MASTGTACPVTMTERLAKSLPREWPARKAPDDLRATTVDREVDIGGLGWLAGGTDDARASDIRISGPVSVALRAAASRIQAEKEFSSAADVSAADAAQTLGAICVAVRRAYVSGRAGPVSSGPLATQMLDRLRDAFIEELDDVRVALKAGELSLALRAFDLVRREMEGDETQRFVAELRSGNALDLLVEIAHDMRSPLTAILMLCQMVRRALTQSADGVQARQLSLVYSAAFGLNALVNDVIALARDGDRLIDPDPVPFSMSGLMNSVAGIIRPIAEERKLALVLDTQTIGWRVGQPIALSRVLLNLASNALKYTQAGEVAISAVELAPTHVRFDIRDTGPGIPPDVMPALFEPFVRRSPTARSRRFSRTGLGLTICRKLLRDMGSELRVETAPGKGTRFFFELTLPVAPDCELRREESVASML
jgi:signal transduction histidine kinase